MMMANLHVAIIMSYQIFYCMIRLQFTIFFISNTNNMQKKPQNQQG